MSKTACVSCSTRAPDPADGSTKPQLFLTVALAVAVLVRDAGVDAAVTKTSTLSVVALVLLAFAVTEMLRGERRTLTLPLVLWSMATGWLVTTLAWSEHAVVLAVFPSVCATALAVALVGMPLAVLEVMAARVAMLVGATSSLGAMWSYGQPRSLQLVGNPDWFGLVLVAAIPFIVMRARATAGIERHLATLAAVLSVVGLVLSQSRSAWIGGAVAAVWLARGRWRWAVAFASVVGAAFMFTASGFGAALHGRTWIWENALRAGLQDPILGVGVGRFAFPFLDAQGAALETMRLDVAAVKFLNATSAHNDAIHLFVEGGVVAPMLVLGALAAAAWQLRSRWRAGAAAIIAIAASGLGDVALRQPGVLLFVAFALAGCPPLRPRRHDGYLGAIVLLTNVCLLPYAAEQWIAERRMEQAKSVPPVEGVELLTAAANMATDAGRPALDLGLRWLALGEPERAERWFLKSEETLANVGTDVAIATSRHQRNDSAGAIRSLQRALRRHPARFAAHTNLVEVARHAGELGLAERHLAAAKELQPNHPKLRHIEEALRRTMIERASKDETAIPK